MSQRVSPRRGFIVPSPGVPTRKGLIDPNGWKATAVVDTSYILFFKENQSWGFFLVFFLYMSKTFLLLVLTKLAHNNFFFPPISKSPFSCQLAEVTPVMEMTT